ncbi:MAG: hypothetical protein WBL23_10110 [Salinisphaera sp.]|uniref:RIFT barrel domain-containing protein n=1 Tax=Salinisphaera sp. TaxID=1914330 RepID=UPI003C7B10C9
MAESTGSTPGRTVTLGQVFKKGDVPKGQSVTAKVGGQAIPTQIDPKATWDDGSLRHAVITVRLPQAPDSSGTRVSLVATSSGGNSGQSISINDLLATDFSGKISFKMQGQTYNADARTLLRQAVQGGGCPQWGASCKRWLSGPLASEWIVGGPVSSGSNTAPHLAVYFHIRAYGNGQGQIARARVDTVIENDWAYASDPHDLHYNADLQVGNQSYPVNGLTHYEHARWHHVLWWQGNPHVYAALNTNYLQASHAISNYADVKPSNSFLNSVPKQFAPMDNGDQTKDMGSTGAQAAIGPLPRWTTTYAVSGDYRAFQWMLADDSAAGSYGFHYRDQKTGRPLTITDHPDVTVADYNWASQAGGKLGKDLLPACKSDCHTPYTFNIAHQPSVGYLPYLVTGDYYYLEEMQFAAAYDEMWANESYRKYAKGILRIADGQVRAQAWALREISDAAFATPNSDPMKSYFTGLMKNILADYNDHYVGTGVTPIHTLTDGDAFVYPSHGADRVALAPWQADFFTWAVGHAAEQGMPGAKSFLDWLASFQIQRMTDWIDKPSTGFCWLEASAYTLQLRDSRNSPIYGDMSQVYKANFPQLVGTQCNSSAMILRLNNNSSNTHYGQNEMVGFPTSPTGFPANFQIGLAMAVDSGDSNGAKAWQLFDSRSKKPDYSNYPNFAVEPRSVSSAH